MRGRRLPHLATRPTWRCQSCGIAWPCSAAKLSLLGEYRENRSALVAYLMTLRDEAAGQCHGTKPADLDDRFVAWARCR
ncbi:flavin reductase [Micromonospora sp. NPDC049275]|uniref:flavin reductase n=1 Tax=Micromonospora sp. NPDC049275 TaxID=3364268 RepID=UPI00371DDEA1